MRQTFCTQLRDAEGPDPDNVRGYKLYSGLDGLLSILRSCYYVEDEGGKAQIRSNSFFHLQEYFVQKVFTLHFDIRNNLLYSFSVPFIECSFYRGCSWYILY